MLTATLATEASALGSTVLVQ